MLSINKREVICQYYITTRAGFEDKEMPNQEILSGEEKA